MARAMASPISEVLTLLGLRVGGIGDVLSAATLAMTLPTAAFNRFGGLPVHGGCSASIRAAARIWAMGLARFLPRCPGRTPGGSYRPKVRP